MSDLQHRITMYAGILISLLLGIAAVVPALKPAMPALQLGQTFATLPPPCRVETCTAIASEVWYTMTETGIHPGDPAYVCECPPKALAPVADGGSL